MGFFSGSTEIITPEAPQPSAAETGAFTGAQTAFTGAAGDIDRQRALEQEVLGAQRGVTGTSRQLQELILQNLIQNLSPEGLRGQAGLVTQAFAEPAAEGRRQLTAFAQNQGFNEAGTTPTAQARGRFEAVLASQIAQALIQNQQFSSQLGLGPVTPSVPQVPGALPSTGLGIGLGQAQSQLGSTLGNIRAATFRPEILSQGPKAPGVFGGIGTVLGGAGGFLLGGPAGAAIGAGLGGVAGSTLGSSLSRG